MSEPSVTSDPRFRAGRNLVKSGRANDGAIGMFATLVEESRRQYGEDSIEAAACYYEYGNALFRSASKQLQQKVEGEETAQNGSTGADKKTQSRTFSAKKAAAAAELRSRKDVAAKTELSKKPKAADRRHSRETETAVVAISDEIQKNAAESVKKDTEKNTPLAISVKDDDDVGLALELMENAWSILDEFIHKVNGNQTQTKPHKLKNSEPDYKDWATDQVPRVLVGIGDVLSFMDRHADAADAYTRAIPHREAAVEKSKPSSSEEKLTVEYLRRRRLLTETNVLVAEELLACSPDHDVVTTETKDVLVKCTERIEFARGYYDKARDELQETVYLMGKIASSGIDLGTEKEDVCFLATILMGVGTSLAELDESADQHAPKKKQKIK